MTGVQADRARYSAPGMTGAETAGLPAGEITSADIISIQIWCARARRFGPADFEACPVAGAFPFCGTAGTQGRPGAGAGAATQKSLLRVAARFELVYEGLEACG